MKKFPIILIIFLINLAFAEAYIPLNIDGKTVNIEGIKSADEGIFLFNKIMTDEDVEKLRDSAITFQSSDYDIEENVMMNIKVDLEKGYKSDIGYYFMFSEPIDATKATRSRPLEIRFLGKNLKILDADNDEITVYNTDYEDLFFNSGDRIEKDGKIIRLARVGSGGAIVVDVDGVTETIASGATETVNGIDIVNEETHYDSNNQAASAANLIISKDLFKTYKNGDEYPDNPQWKWDINNLNEKAPTIILDNELKGPYIGVKYDSSWEKLNEEACVNLPNNYLSICLSDLTDYFYEDESGCLAGIICCGNNICETGENKETCFGDCKVCMDEDRDGFKAGDCNEDCNDNDAKINPKFPEICDGLDNNCNGKIDEDLTRQCGESNIGACSFGTESCNEGIWDNCTAVFPVREICDNLDNNCNGLIDECCDGCLYNEKCLSKKERVNEGIYCNYDRDLELLKEINEECSFDYECLTYNCQNKICSEKTVVKTIVNWFVNLFG